MIGTHEEWMGLIKLRDSLYRLSSRAPCSAFKAAIGYQAGDLEKLIKDFELTEESFLNHGEEPNNGVECKQPS